MKKINAIVVGTHNKGKFREICDLLPKNVIKISPNELNLPSPKETGKTFIENSKIKAKYYSNESSLIAISDDSGLAISLLADAPGIFSSRWAGPKKDFNVAIKRVYKELANIKFDWDKNKKVLAKFVCCITLHWPNGKNISSIGIVKGKISRTKKGNYGFGYDPIFIPQGYSKTFGQLNPKKKMRIDHRSKAFAKIKKYFN